MHNLHITLTEFRNESRLLKETASLLHHGLFKSIAIAALHTTGLAEREVLNEKCNLFRLRIRSKSLPRSFIFQLVKYAEFCIRVILLAMRHPPNVINVHTLALLPLGVFLKYLFRARLVYDAHELETEVEGLQGLHQRVSRLVERLCIRSVDLTILVGPMICDWYRNRYQIESVVAVLNCPPLKKVASNGRLRQELGIGSHLKVCLYQGALCSGRGIEFLLDSFEHHSIDDSLVLVCMGYGELEDAIKGIAARCPRIYYFPAVPPTLILEYTVDADIGFALFENSCISHQLCLPNKLFEYAMASVPVVCSPMPEMAALIQKYGIGTLIEATSPIGLWRALHRVSSFERRDLQMRLLEFKSRFCWEKEEIVMINAYKKYLLM